MTVAEASHPQPLIEPFAALEEQVTSASHIALFLDFDGTISSIVPKPEDAELDPGIRPILNRLIARQDFNICIVSGRAAADVRGKANLDNVIYAGNHGLEIETSTSCFRQPEAEALRRELKCLSLQLRLALSETDGLEIEDKGLTLSVHFRRVTEHLHDWVRSVTYGTVGRSRSFTCREGKSVLDVRPQIDWHKGRAVKWVAHELFPSSALLIYIGDDTTDEDAFAAISDGITIRVGETTETEAQYSLPDIQGVGQFLHWLDRAKPHAPLASSQRAGR